MASLTPRGPAVQRSGDRPKPAGDAETGRLAVQRLDCPSEKIDITRLARRSIRHFIEIVFVLQGFAKTDGSKVESNLITSWNILVDRT
jgi:hypothetical protein